MYVTKNEIFKLGYKKKSIPPKSFNFFVKLVQHPIKVQLRIITELVFIIITLQLHSLYLHQKK